MKSQGERVANIELLRVTCMIMIIVYHIVSHAVNIQINNTASPYNSGFCRPELFPQLIIIYIIMPFGMIGNNIFLLISGYFMVKKKDSEVSLIMISKKLICQQGYAALILLIVPTFWYVVSAKGSGLNPELQSINLFNEMSWYVGYWFMVVLVGELIKRRMWNYVKKHYLSIIIVLFVFVEFSYIGNLLSDISNSLRMLLTGLCIYLIGGYLRLYNPYKNIKTSIVCWLIIIAYICIILSSYNVALTNIGYYIKEGTNGDFYQKIPTYEVYNIVVILISICIFELFCRINLSMNRVINCFGGIFYCLSYT